MYIIDDEIKNLVLQIEAPAVGAAVDKLLGELVRKLQAACSRPAVAQRYADYRAGIGLPPPGLKVMPLNEAGFLRSFDPLTEEAQFVAAWHEYGIVASKAVVAPALCEAVIDRIGSITRELSGGLCDLNDPSTWSKIPVDGEGVSVLSRGFFEVYHDQVLAALRQAVRVYLHHVLIWGRADLWTTFDRLGVKLPGHEESAALPLHVDQNPNVHAQFRTVQGVLALRDCPVERGTFVGVPGSRMHFAAYGAMAKNQGEYVELERSHELFAALTAAAQACPLAQGDLISWDSRTTHANSANLSALTRYVAYISAAPANAADAAAVQARAEALRTGVGKNVRNALMHASKPPRYTNPELLSATRQAEKLTYLGSLLYGQESYENV